MNVTAGIEDVSSYGDSACLDVNQLAGNRGLDWERFDSPLMKEKAATLPFEDPVSFAINAARPLLSRLSPEDKGRIEMLVTYTESGADFGRSTSMYAHDALGLGRNCRLFEVKNACYSGMVGFSAVINPVLSQASPGVKGLVVTTDMAKLSVVEGGDVLSEDWSLAEPSDGAGAAAILVGENPKILSADAGANGCYGFEAMDICRPIPDSETGNADLPLMSYLDCCEPAYREYEPRVASVSYTDTFDFLSFHTPLGGMVKGAHRIMMRRLAYVKGERIEQDFQDRVAPGLSLCSRVGDIMGGSIFPNLLGTIEQGRVTDPSRIGCFSYGSGCCSEFYSGVIDKGGQDYVRSLKVSQALNEQHELSFVKYEELMRLNSVVSSGIRNWEPMSELLGNRCGRLKGIGCMVLTQIEEFHHGCVTS